MALIKFDPVGGHLVKIPVTINGTIHTNFLLDTGAGVNVISERLCQQIGCKKEGSYTGKRMTGEEITLQFTHVPQISVGSLESKNVRAGVLDIFEKLPKELGVIDGAVSLRFFENQPFTIDYVNSTVELNSTSSGGQAVPVHLETDQEKIIAFVEMANLGSFEVDTGNSVAVLNLSKAKTLRVDLKAKDVKKVEGKNETGHPFVAYYTSIPELKTGSGNVRQEKPKVAFKQLIHDGVIGNDFFKGRKVTFDIPNKLLRFQ